MNELSTMPAETLLSEMAKRQEDAIMAEAEEARGKAKLEAILGAVIDHLNKKEGKSLEVAKRLAWSREEVVQAHEEYLCALVDYKRAQAGQIRAREALGLWRTLRSDLRNV